MKRYTTYEEIDRGRALELILTGDVIKTRQAFIALTYHDSDPQWVAEKLYQYVEHKHPGIRGAAIHSLFLLSRTKGVLNAAKAYEIAAKNLEAEDTETREAADSLLDEVAKAGLSLEPIPLEEIEKTIEGASDLEKIIAVGELFRWEDPRTEVQRLGKRVMAQPEPIVRGFCLLECRAFLIGETLDTVYATELIRMAEEKETPYIRRMIRSFKDWLHWTDAAMKETP